MTDRIRLGSVTVNAPDATALARFYAEITGGAVTFEHASWATVVTDAGRIDCQTVVDHAPSEWPHDPSTRVHLDFLVDDLVAASGRVERAGATRLGFQPNAEHCIVFADPAGNPFCLTTIDEIG